MSNDLIEHESKSLVQTTSQILKEELGVNEYFRAVSEFEDRKRQGKAEDKVRMAELAILDPEEFAAEKRAKKRKV
jgi:nicotinic acid mononucleotide adenylyltransferase